MRTMGVGTSVSALVTVLLLVSALFIVSLASQSVFSERVVELRKASEVASASSEVLQAFVYKDADTNRSLLTLRNSGATGLEITDILAVSHEGNVVKSLKLPATLRLGPQQTATSYLSSIVGEEFDDYETVRNTIASFYFKTFRGRVFGSMYLAPASLDIAAYSTSTTHTTSLVTSTETLTIPSITTTFTTRTITVIVDNPSHWPVETYVGVAFPRTPFGGGFAPHITDGFPEWGFHPGLQAKNHRDEVQNVTLQDIRLPKHLTCWIQYVHWVGVGQTWYYRWSGGFPATKLTELGPTYVAVRYARAGSYPVCIGSGMVGEEQFIPHSTVRNIDTPTTQVVALTETGQCSSSQPPYTCTGSIRFNMSGLFIDTIQVWATATSSPDSRRSNFYGSVSTPWGTVSCNDNMYRPNQTRTCYRGVGINSFADPFTLTFSGGGSSISSISVQVEVRYRHYYSTSLRLHNITFPGYIVFRGEFTAPWNGITYYSEDIYRLAYVKAVDMWNTSNVLAFSGGGNVLRVKIDRPVGLAAVYVYDRTVAHLPPPPSPPPPATACINTVNICESGDVETRVRYESGGGHFQCADDPGGTQVVFRTSNPNDCDAFIAPAAGTYSENQLPACPKNGNTITCTASPGQTIIVDCKH
ncbi:MAG: hypothetical protein QW420_07340 [Candidatus Caldarchaeum sp.]